MSATASVPADAAVALASDPDKNEKATQHWVATVKFYAVLVVNVLGAVLIVPFNKFLFKTLAFKWVVSLTWIHFLVTFAVSHFWMAVAHTETVDIPWWELQMPGLLKVVVLAMMNLSLFANNVSIYQIARITTLPATLLVSLVLGSTQGLSRTKVACVGATTAGLWCLFQERITEITLAGQLYSLTSVLIGVFSTFKLAQLQTKYAGKLKVSQLLASTLPVQMLLLGALVLITEPFAPASILQDSTWMHWAMIAVTSCFAVVTNVTNQYLVGKLSPVTMALSGQLKNVLVVLFGVLFFHDSFQPTPLNFLGVVLTLGGAFVYSLYGSG